MVNNAIGEFDAGREISCITVNKEMHELLCAESPCYKAPITETFDFAGLPLKIDYNQLPLWTFLYEPAPLKLDPKERGLFFKCI